jgi:chemotaxis family two-component system response regulator Rcp1
MRTSAVSINVVEDNPTDVFLIHEAMAAHGVDADLTVFEDGEKAICLIERIEADENEPCPRLMLLDLNLPRTDGFTVLERLRKSPRCAAIPVIVMSSSAIPSDRNRSLALGANAYFQKQSGYSASLEIGAIIRKFLD